MKQTTYETPPPSSYTDPIARLLAQVAWLMDRALTVPGTKVSVGLDALIGLLPFGGDVLTGTIQAALVLVAMAHYRVPRPVAARMLANVLVDVAVGTVPLVGDVFDVAFKANTRNMALLEPYLPPGTLPGRQAPSNVVIDVTPSRWRWGYLVPIGLGVFAVLAFALVGFVVFVRWLFRA